MPAWMKYPADNAANIGEQVTYGYNTQGAFDTLKSSISSYYYVPITLYDAAGRLVQRQYGAPNLASNPLLKSVYTYNGWGTDGGRLQKMTTELYATPFTLLHDLRYTYDDAGNILTIQDYKAGNPQTQTFTYDNLNRLKSAVAANGTGNYGNYSQEKYSYDLTTGNIYSTTVMGNYTYTDSAHKHAVTKLNGTQKYWYDANGNMTTRITDATYTLSYNAENQMPPSRAGALTRAMSMMETERGSRAPTSTRTWQPERL